MFPETVQQVKRWLKILSGFTLLAVGIVMLVTPGPGWLVIIAGLALLAAEYVWAQRLLQRLKTGGARLRNAVIPSWRTAAAESSPATPSAEIVASSDSISAPAPVAQSVAQSEDTLANAPASIKT